MVCETCDESPGYIWDTFIACPDCVKGHSVQFSYDKAELKNANKRVLFLRKRIKRYKESNERPRNPRDGK